MAATVKAHFLKGDQTDTIRRFSMPASEGLAMYEALRAKARSVFPELQTEDFDLYWKDDEGDLITFSSDAELSDAYNLTGKDVFKIYMRQKGECKKAKVGGPMWTSPWEAHGPAHFWGAHMMHKPYGHGWGPRAWWRHAMGGGPCQKRAAKCQAEWEVNAPKQKCADTQNKDVEDEKPSEETEIQTTDDAMEGDTANTAPQRCGRGRGRGFGGCGRGGRARKWAAWMKYMSEMAAAADGGDDAARQQQFFRQFYHPMSGQAVSPDQEGKPDVEGCQGAPQHPQHPPCMAMGPPWMRHMFARSGATSPEKQPETESDSTPSDQELPKDQCESQNMEASDENNKENAPGGRGKGGKCGGRRGRGGRFWRMGGMPPGFMMSQHGDPSEMAQMWAMYGGGPPGHHGHHGHHMADHPFRGMRGQFMRNHGRQMMREHMGCGWQEHDTANTESPNTENNIEEVVQRLEAMGFENPDGYLAGLVQENEGDMEKVLDQLRKDQ